MRLSHKRKIAHKSGRVVLFFGRRHPGVIKLKYGENAEALISASVNWGDASNEKMYRRQSRKLAKKIKKAHKEQVRLQIKSAGKLTESMNLLNKAVDKARIAFQQFGAFMSRVSMSLPFRKGVTSHKEAIKQV